jgi:hypothetical protein
MWIPQTFLGTFVVPSLDLDAVLLPTGLRLLCLGVANVGLISILALDDGFFQELGAILIPAGLHGEDVGVFSSVALYDVCLMLMGLMVVLTAVEPCAIM